MDGTFIPLSGNDQNRRDLVTLGDALDRHGVELMYVTGRHYQLVMKAIREEGLPSPPWMICDVGASIYHVNAQGQHCIVEDYRMHLQELVGDHDRNGVLESLKQIDAVRLQESEKQTSFKISFYCDADTIGAIADQVRHCIGDAPWNLISSVDPFTGNGLIDLLPRDVSKAYALKWWAAFTGTPPSSIVFSGDSGNDLAALTAGYRAVVVGNAHRAVADAATKAHRLAGWTDRLVIAQSHATSGVLEGFQHFAGQQA